MKNFNLLLNQAINSNIESFVKVVADKYKLKSSELIDLWYGKSNSNTSEGTDKEVEFESESEEETKSSSKSNSSGQKSGCQYKSTKGKNEGSLCGSKVCSESSTGLYCKKHIKQEQKSPKKEAPKSTTVKKTVPVQKEETKVSIEHVQKKITNFGVSKNNFGNYWNEQSGIVFDKVTKQAIGKQQQNGDVNALTKQDIEFCKMHNIAYKLPTNIVSSQKESFDDDEESVDDDEDDYDEDEIDEDELN